MKLLKTIFFIIVLSFFSNIHAEIDTKNIVKSKNPIKYEISDKIFTEKFLLDGNKTYKILNEAQTKVKKKGKILKLRGGNNVYSKNVSKVVLIYNDKLESIGAGSLVDKEGFIVTNWHVVQKAKDVAVWFKTPGVSEPLEKNVILGNVILTDKGKDLGIIKIAKVPEGVTPVSLGSANSVSVGDPVHAIGHPEGLFWSYSQGVVSAKRKKYKWAYENSKHEADMIQTQTPISSGNSGGALLDSKGNLVGINTANLGSGQNLNFAVEVDHAKSLLKKKHSNKKNKSTSSKSTGECFATQDHDKNGVIDTCFLDKNRNGKVDGWLIDEDENGYWEKSVMDEDEDGNFNFAAVDKDQNGKFEIGYLDKNDDGTVDVVGYDHNEDGEWDEFKKA